MLQAQNLTVGVNGNQIQVDYDIAFTDVIPDGVVMPKKFPSHRKQSFQPTASSEDIVQYIKDDLASLEVMVQLEIKKQAPPAPDIVDAIKKSIEGQFITTEAVSPTSAVKPSTAAVTP